MNSFFSLKVGGRRGKPIVSRSKLVNRDKKIVVVVAAITAGVLTFSLSMGQRLLEINRSNSQALSGPTETVSGQKVDGLEAISKQVEENAQAGTDLRQSYEAFNSDRDNMDWSRRDLACLSPCQDEDVEPVLTVLDALPSRYDGLVFRHQLQSFFNRQNFQPQNISLPASDSGEAGSEGWVEIPVEINLQVNATDVLRFVETLNNSIRPMVIKQLSVTKGSDSNKWNMKVTFNTYYQPETELTFAEVVIPNEKAPSPESQDESEGS